MVIIMMTNMIYFIDLILLCSFVMEETEYQLARRFHLIMEVHTRRSSTKIAKMPLR